MRGSDAWCLARTNTDALRCPLLRFWNLPSASILASTDFGSENGDEVEISDLVEAVRTDRFRVTEHADEETAADSLLLSNVLESLYAGEVIEYYPADRPYPSCLVFGFTETGDPVHSVWAFSAESKWAVLITVYRPDSERWIEWRRRRKR